MTILSIQSHVAFGCVGNKAAVFPLQTMGHDVWPVNTVQFSNHTGYGKWGGEIFSSQHIRSVINGLEKLGKATECQAILSGYMGSKDICHEVLDAVKRFKAKNKDILYLCDPVIGNTSCYVRPEVLEFFKTQLHADIITPNQFEAEILSGITIKTFKDLKMAAKFFHNRGIKIIIITGVKITECKDKLCIFLFQNNNIYMIETKEYPFESPPSGTGDLLSSLFLGNYITTKDPLLSLQRTIYFMDLVLSNTFKAGSYELKILNINYAALLDKKLLPKALKLDIKLTKPLPS